MATPLFLQWRPSSMENANGDENRGDEEKGKKGSDGLISNGEIPPLMGNQKQVTRPVRKNAKVIQKRIPQRGLGVAQLERLRLEERWKKMTEQHQNQQNQQNQFQFQLPFAFLNNRNGGTSTTASHVMSFVDQWRPPCFGPDSQKLIGNGGGSVIGVSGFTSNMGASGFTSNMGTPHHFGFGSTSTDRDREVRVVQQGNPFFVENNGQTLPFHYCLFNNCEICFQKRRSGSTILSEQISGFNQEKRNHVELMRAPMMSQGSDQFLDLTLGSKRPINYRDFMFNKPADCSSFGSKVQDQEREVMGVHRKNGNTNNMGSVIREYEFFPTHNGSSSISRSSGSNKDYYQYCSSTITSVGAEATEGSPAVLSEEASYTTNTDTKRLDLSLKLSC